MEKSMVQGAESNMDLALNVKWLLQVQFTFIFEKTVEVEAISFFLERWKDLHL
jgi:hypothetical protein